MESGFCEECGTFVDMTPDIRGVESDEGKMIHGRLVCSACAESLEECES